MKAKNIQKNTPVNNKSRIPENSVLFEKIVPAALVFMGVLTVVLVLFAAGVLLGIIQF